MKNLKAWLKRKSLRTELHELETELLDRCDEFEHDIEKQKEEITKLGDLLGDHCTEVDAKFDALDDETDKYVASLSQIDDALDQIREELGRAMARIDRLETENEVLKTQLNHKVEGEKK